MTTSFEATGGCLCGAVAYRVTAPAKSLEHCHCSKCRRAHGALTAAGALVDAEHFEVVRGREALVSFTSTPGNHRWFCGRCGCHIYMSVDDIPAELYYWAGSLDDGMAPGHPTEKECHIFMGSKACWDRLDDALPAHDGLPEGIGPGKA